MNYYIDQEFNEGFRKPLRWLPTIGSFNKPYHFIDLISIGIVSDDGREYYAVCNEFNIKEAYYKHNLEKIRNYGDSRNISEYRYNKNYWLRENVLGQIFFSFYKQGLVNLHYVTEMSLSKLKGVIKQVGKSKKQIRLDILSFICDYSTASEYAGVGSIDSGWEAYVAQYNPVFYGYYADYDWVLFCSLFGTMMDLPKGFPMYCKDLQQIKDEYIYLTDGTCNPDEIRKNVSIDNHPLYPKQTNEHHALADAKWNLELHKFLKSI